MYLPPAFRVSEPSVLESFIERYGFATLVTHRAEGVVASHVPLLLDRSRGKAVLIGHVARANEQWKWFDGTREALAIFHGPHAYVSPSWYAAAPAVPTWNYAAVHVYGKPQLIEDGERKASVMATLVAKYESARSSPWSMGDLPMDFREKLMAGIAAFEMPADKIEGKFKLSQNRSREDQRGVLTGLCAEDSQSAKAFAEFMARHLAIE